MQVIDKAERLMLQGNFSQAGTLLHTIIVDAPDDLRAICDIGIVYTETGENDKALRTLNYCIDKDEKNHEAWEALGCVWFRKKDYEKAEIYFRKAFKLDPEGPSIMRNLGVLLGITGREQEGYTLLLKSREQNPEDYRTLYALAYTHARFGNTGKAIKTLTQLLQFDLPDEIRIDAENYYTKLQLDWL